MIYVLLPSFNEENGLTQLLPRLKTLAEQSRDAFKIVVVDDGSRDRTSEVALSFSDRLDLKLIRFEKNRGVGEVFRSGFQFVCQDSLDPDNDMCIALDSDNTQDPDIMVAMIQKVKSGDDLVIASRFEGEGRMLGCPWHRSVYSYGISWLLRILTQLPAVKDFSTFYRAYRVRLLQKGFERYGDDLLAGRGFSMMGACLLKLANLTERISEVPCILRYDLKVGTSGNKILKSIHGYLELIAAYVKTNRYKNLPHARQPAVALKQ